MWQRKIDLAAERGVALLERHWKWAVLAVWLLFCAWFIFSRWSFRGLGSRDLVRRRTWRLFLVSLVSLGLNALFVFILTDSMALGGPWWWPLIPILFVTPAVTFVLNRQWVFR
jgi:hypothetical protein